MQNPSGLLTVEEVAAHLGLAVFTIRRLCRQGRIGHYRIGRGKGNGFRFSPRHIAEFLESREARPRAA